MLLKLFSIRVFLIGSMLLLQAELAEAYPLYLAESSEIPEARQTTADEKESVSIPFIKGDLERFGDVTELNYLYVLGELYAQRGDFISGARLIFKVAEVTRDPRLGRRALQLSLKAQELELSISATNLLMDSLGNDSLAIGLIFSTLGAEKNLTLVLGVMGKVIRRVPEESVGRFFIQLTDFISNHSNRDQTLSVASDILKGFDQVPEKHFFLAKAAQWASDFSLALIRVEQALSIKPDMARAIVLKANLLSRDNPQDAVGILKGFVDKYPGKDFVRVALARAQFLNGQLEESRNEFYKLSTKNPQNSYYAYSIGIISSEVGDWRTADQYLQLALKMGHVLQETIKFKLGVVNEELGKLEDAGRWYMSVERGENFILARAQYVGILIKQNKFDQAQNLLNSTKPEGESQEVQLLQAKAYLYRKIGEYQEAFDILNAAIDNWPNHQELLYDIAIAAEKINRIDLVEKHLVYLIKLNPKHAQAYNALGYTLAERTQRYNEAFEYIQSALKLEPHDPYILDSMGWVCFKMGDVLCGKKYLKAAYKVRPDPEIAAHLGELLWQEGQKKEAEKIWRESLDANPDSDPLKLIIEKYLD